MKNLILHFRFLHALHFVNSENSEINNRFKGISGESDELKVRTIRKRGSNTMEILKVRTL